MSSGDSENIGFADIFVGRQQELSLLCAALDEAASGHGQVVVLTGEPGIGKTTLAEKLIEEAAVRTHTTLRGACFDGDYSPPLWLWTQVIRSALESPHGDEAFGQLAQRQQSVISGIVPELSVPLPDDASPDAATRSGPHDERGRFELHDSIARYLGYIGRIAPTVIWLDDLHWADNSDLVLLEFASQQLAGSPIMILGTYRDTDVTRDAPLARSLGQLTRMKGFRRIQLSGLHSQEMERLIQRSASAQLSALDSNRLVERAAGNPLFGRELARGISESSVGLNGPDVRLPEGIAEAIGRRMAGIDDRQLDVLRSAAVFGAEFSVAELEASMGPGSDAVESTIDAASSKALVEELASSPGTFRFTHALIQETLQGELTPTQLVRTHARIANALVTLPDAKAASKLSAIARHYREGVLLLDLSEAIEHTLRAGDHALSSYSYVEAADHYGWVAESMPDRSDSFERADLLEKCAVAMLQSGTLDRQLSWDKLCDAVRMYIRIGKNEDAVRTASFPAVIGGMTGVVELVEEALQCATPGTSDRAWLLARYIISLGDSGRSDEAESTFAEAVEIANELGNERLMARVLVHGAQAGYRANDPALCVSRGLEAIDLALRLDEPLSVLRVLDFCVESLCAIGQTSDALELLHRCRDVRNELADPFAPEVRAALMISWFRGDWSGFNAVLTGLIDDDRRSSLVNWIAAHRGLRHGKPDADLYKTLVPTFSKWNIDAYFVAVNILSTWLQFQSHPELMRLCEQLRFDDPLLTAEGDVRRRGLAVLLALSKGNVPDPDDIGVLNNSKSLIIPRTDIPISRILGAACVATGEYEAARDHIEASVEFCRDAEFWPSLAWSLFDLIRLAEKSPVTVEVERAQNAADEALKLCDDLEIPALTALIRESMERLNAGQSGSAESTAFPDGLSEREVEVLALVAAGRSNQEIADDLFISRYTVVRHVSNIFQKSGASNRTEAAAYAHQYGLS